MRKIFGLVLMSIGLGLICFGLMILLGSMIDGWNVVASIFLGFLLAFGGWLFKIGLKQFKKKKVLEDNGIESVTKGQSLNVAGREEIVNAVMELNKDENPFHVLETNEENADLVVQWNIVDAKWREVFGKAGMKQTYKMYLKFYPETKKVHSIDKCFKLSWNNGLPTIGASFSMQKGQVYLKKREIAFGLKEEKGAGKIYDIDFDSSRIKKAVKEVITSQGWTLKSVIFGGL